MSLRSYQLAAMFREFEELSLDKEAATALDEGTAQEELPQPVPAKKPPHPMLTAAKYLGAYGLGTGLGYGGMYGAQKLLGRPFNPAVMHTVPVLTGLGGLALTHAQNTLFSKMKEDAVKRREHGR